MSWKPVQSFLGIDPGASGGMAIIWQEEGRTKTVSCKMPATELDIFMWLKGEERKGITHAIIEKVQGYIGGVGNTGSSMFKFGHNYGALRMALIALGIPFEEVAPHVWQAALKMRPRDKKEKKGAFKNRLKAKAQQLFPKAEVTLKTADALLIAEHARRSHS